MEKQHHVVIPPRDLTKCRTCGGSRGCWVYSRAGDAYYSYERKRPELSDPLSWSEPCWEHCRTCNPDDKYRPRKRKCSGKTIGGKRCSRKVLGEYCRQHKTLLTNG
jgi:hypothetical protein